MKELKSILLENDTRSIIEELMVLDLVSKDLSLDESISDLKGKIKKASEASGLHIGKSKGLISIILSAGKLMGNFFLAAIKSDKEKLKEIANTEITKEQFLDFLLKLDTLTMHLITGPIHIIDAVTGWHVGVNLKKTAELTKKSIESAINSIRKVVDIQPAGKIQTQMFNYIRGLKRIILEK